MRLRLAADEAGRLLPPRLVSRLDELAWVLVAPRVVRAPVGTPVGMAVVVVAVLGRVWAWGVNWIELAETLRDPLPALTCSICRAISRRRLSTSSEGGWWRP